MEDGVQSCHQKPSSTALGTACVLLQSRALEDGLLCVRSKGAAGLCATHRNSTKNDMVLDHFSASRCCHQTLSALKSMPPPSSVKISSCTSSAVIAWLQYVPEQ